MIHTHQGFGIDPALADNDRMAAGWKYQDSPLIVGSGISTLYQKKRALLCLPEQGYETAFWHTLFV